LFSGQHTLQIEQRQGTYSRFPPFVDVCHERPQLGASRPRLLVAFREDDGLEFSEAFVGFLPVDAYEVRQAGVVALPASPRRWFHVASGPAGIC